MKSFFCTACLQIACLLSIVSVQAQTTSLSLSKKFSIKDPVLPGNGEGSFRIENSYYSIGVDYKGMQLAFTARLDKVKYGMDLYKYDLDMREQAKIAFHGREKEFGPFPPRFLRLNGKILLFYYKVQQDNSITLSVSAIDPETLNETKNKDLYTISEKNVGILKLGEAFNNNSLTLSRSPDNNKLLVSQSGNTNEVFSCVIDGNAEIEKPTVSSIGKRENFKINDCRIDNNENKYYTYTYLVNKLNKRGILIQNSNSQEKYLEFNISQGSFTASPLSLELSKDNTKMNVYASYGGEYLDEGVLLTTVDAVGLTIKSPTLFPFPQDLKEKVTRLGFGSKNKGNFSILPIGYNCIEFEDGTIALNGSAIRSVSASGVGINGNLSLTKYMIGPFINIFIKAGESHFAILERDDSNTGSAGGSILIPCKNSLVCIYNDTKKNLDLNNPAAEGGKKSRNYPLLAEAVLSSDGSVLSRKEVAPSLDGASFFLDGYFITGNHQYTIPVARNRVNMARYYTELEQWAILDVTCP